MGNTRSSRSQEQSGHSAKRHGQKKLRKREMQSTIDELQSRISRRDTSLAELQREKSACEQDIRKLQEEKVELLTRISRREKSLGELQQGKLACEKDIRQLQEEKVELLTRISRRDKSLGELQQGKLACEQDVRKLREEKAELLIRISRRDTSLDELQQKKLACEKDIRQLQEEKAELLIRLSALASAKLLDRNENIADLSDVNRPTKIAEQFSELYDNEWTDAFAYLTREDYTAGSSQYENVNRLGHIRNSCTEQEACKILLDMLFKIYSKSLEVAEEEMEKLISGLTAMHGGQEPPLELVMQFKDTRKKNYGIWSVETSPSLAADIRRLLPGKRDLQHEKIKSYVDKCMLLCRLMAVQDPPVYIEQIDYQKDAKFNGNLYKQFTKSGPVVEFFVWPPLFLSKGGNLLSKGVAQGMSSSAKPGHEYKKKQQNVPSPQKQAFVSGQLNAVSSKAKEEQNIIPVAMETAQVPESDGRKLEAKEEERNPTEKLDPDVKRSSVRELKEIFTDKNKPTQSSVSISHNRSDDRRVNKAAFTAEVSGQPDPASEKKEMTHEPLQTTNRPQSKDQISSQEKNGPKHISVVKCQSRN